MTVTSWRILGEMRKMMLCKGLINSPQDVSYTMPYYAASAEMPDRVEWASLFTPMAAAALLRLAYLKKLFMSAFDSQGIYAAADNITIYFRNLDACLQRIICGGHFVFGASYGITSIKKLTKTFK